MDFEDRIRIALKQDAQDIRVSSNVRRRVQKQLGHRPPFKKWIVSIGSAGILLLGANSIVSAATGESLLDVIVHYTRASQGGAFGSGFGLVPSTPSTSSKTVISSRAGQSARTNDSTGKPRVARATVITGPVVNGNGFEDVRYDDHLIHFLGTSRFPKLNMDNVRVNSIGANLINKAQEKFDISADAVISGTRNENISLYLYHNQAGTVKFDGETTAQDHQNIPVNGENASYLAFTNGASTENYITWNRGPWIVVLRGMDVSETTLLHIAQSVDRQAQADS